MTWADIPWKPSNHTLRQFAGLWIVFFAGWACHQGFVHGNPGRAALFAGLAVTVGPVGLWQPQWIRPIFVGWMIAVYPIGWTVSHVLMAVLFYGVFTPVALVFQMIGRDALCLRHRSGQTTYWAPKAVATDMRSYFRQF
jgi:hypothetical protein